MESNLFRSENLDRIRIIPDDYGIHAVFVEPSHDFNTSGASTCRGNYPSNYSIVTKFRPVSERYAFTFLNISTPEGVQLAITLDLCYSMLNITFGSGCPYTPIALPFRPFDLTLEQWHRMSLTVGSSHVALYVDCELIHLLPLDMETCQVLCNDEATVSILQPAAASHCPTGPVSCYSTNYCTDMIQSLLLMLNLLFYRQTVVTCISGYSQFPLFSVCYSRLI